MGQGKIPDQGGSIVRHTRYIIPNREPIHTEHGGIDLSETARWKIGHSLARSFVPQRSAHSLVGMCATVRTSHECLRQI